MEFTVEPTVRGKVPVEGCEIAWARWGESGRPPVVLVHGAAAHMGWWDTVIPGLLSDYSVVALDLSGHGDSGWRGDYSGAHWAAEVAAVAEAAGAEEILLAGHSLGGRVSILVAARHPRLVSDLILVDSPGRPRPGHGRMLRPASRYASLEEGVAAFRLRPPETVENRDFLRRVATCSFRRYDGYWGLKADRDVFRRIPDELVTTHLAEARVPITEIHGEDSPIVTAEAIEYLAKAHPGPTRFISLPGGHHLLFDQGPAIAALIGASRSGPSATSDQGIDLVQKTP